MHYNLGTVYAKLGRLDDAVRELEQAVRLKPDYALAHNNLGNAYIGIGLYLDSVAECDIAIGIDPALALAYLTRAQAKHRLSDADGAKADFERACELDPELKGEPWPPAK